MFVSMRMIAQLFLLGLVAVAGNARAADREVVIYSSIDEPVISPLLKRFEKRTSIHVRFVGDTEATKSASLAERLEAEIPQPQADVYWNNEFVHTIHLADRGAFAPYRTKSADDVPAGFRAKDDSYVAIGLRARMIVVSTRPEFRKLVADIHGVKDLSASNLKGKIGICNPAVGTASAYVSALHLTLGDDHFAALLKDWKANDIQLLGGNSVVVDQVAKGNLAAGFTDNDDIANAKADGLPVEAVVPDQGENAIGTLLIPSTISLVKNDPNPDGAKKLIDFLCDPAIEQELIEAKFFAYSVRDTTKVKAMNVDPVECSRAMRATIEIALKTLQQR